MSAYRLDDLGWENFERLCQALLKASLGIGVEAWGGSGDWGRDAYCSFELRYPGNELTAGPFQFQAKFVHGAGAAGASPRRALMDAVGREVVRLRRDRRSPAVYSLLTNAPLNARLRSDIEDRIRVCLDRDARVVVHGANDLNAWLDSHPAVARSFPQILSINQILQLMPAPVGPANLADPSSASPPLSERLETLRSEARRATRRNAENASKLWEAVSAEAVQEGNTREAVWAQVEAALSIAKVPGRAREGLEILNSCFADVGDAEVGDSWAHLLQASGEVHRLLGNVERARGFYAAALEYARQHGSNLNAGFALLSLGMLSGTLNHEQIPSAGLEQIDAAFVCFSAHLTSRKLDSDLAKQGFALCHLARAELTDWRDPEVALSEYAQAVRAFEELGADWEWDAADMRLRRAGLLARTGEPAVAAKDIIEADEIYRRLEDPRGTAAAQLAWAELLDSVGQRQDAAKHFHRAAALADLCTEPSAGDVYRFRWACKLIELRRPEEADGILLPLLDAPWLDLSLKLDVATQLCMSAMVSQNEDMLRKRSAAVLAIIDTLLREADSPEYRRRLLLKKGGVLEQVGRHADALRYFEKAVLTFERQGDKEGLAEAWFNIRGLRQRMGDRSGERQAIDQVLAAAGEGKSMFVSMSLAMLAQLDMNDGHFDQAAEHLDRAEKLALAQDTINPATVLLVHQLRADLEKERLSSTDGLDAATTPREESDHREPNGG